MEKKLEVIESKVDKLDERLDTIEKVLIKQEANIEIHIKRSNMLEESLEILRKDLKPVEKHVHYVHGALKFIGVLSLMVTFILGLIKLLQSF